MGGDAITSPRHPGPDGPAGQRREPDGPAGQRREPDGPAGQRREPGRIPPRPAKRAPVRGGGEPAAGEPAAPAGPRPLTAGERAVLAKLDGGEPLTVADESALDRLGDHLCGPEAGDDDPGCWPPEADAGCWPLGEDHAGLAGLAGLAGPAGDDVAGGPAAVAADLFDAGFTHRGGTGGAGFAAGGVLDRLEAGWLLARAGDWSWAGGLGWLSDDELAGLLAAQRRLASRAAAGELAVITELAARRARPGGAPGEYLADEIAAVLTLTGWAADRQVTLAAALARLPAVTAALAAGRIDAAKAGVFADELALVGDDRIAAAIATGLILTAAGRTTSQLRRLLRRDIAHFDPEAAARRKDQARQHARVDVWIDPDGTGALAGRGLDPAAAILAGENLDAAARWLQARGAPGTLDQLRAQVLLARLNGHDLTSLLPPPPAAERTGANRTGTAGTGADRTGADRTGGGAPGADTPGVGGTGTAGTGAGGTGPDTPGASADGPGGLGGSVNLTMPAAAWLGQSQAPGHADGYDTIDAATSRDLADTLAAATGPVRWCLTLTDPHGRAIAHGCARAGPGPPGPGRAAWLAAITTTPIETGTCTHRRESAGDRPSAALRHIIKIRSPRCGHPGCARRAERCDDDHTIPHHQGGRTCECNLYPSCNS